jgi:hypothetical protein
MKHVELKKSDYEKPFTIIGMAGYTARGIVFGIIAWLSLQAAIHANPKEAEGTGGAFHYLQKNFGNELMMVLSVGLLSYGIFMFVRAKHEKMSFGMSGK